MGSQSTDKKKNEKPASKQKKVLVHVLSPEASKNVTDYLSKEIYQTILDEIITTNNFSLMLNKPANYRQARVKFIEIHTEIKFQGRKNFEKEYSVGVFLADGNTGDVIMQEQDERIPESRLRFFVRKSLRSFFYDKKKKLSVSNLSLGISDEQIDKGSEEDLKKKIEKEVSAGSSFSPLFEKQKKIINLSPGAASENQGSRYSKDSLENMIPYQFKKKTANKKKQPDKNQVVDVPADNLQQTNAVITLFPNEAKINPDGIDESGIPAYGKRVEAPEMISRALSVKIQEYAEEIERLNPFTDTNFSQEKKQLSSGAEVSEFSTQKFAQKRDFKKTFREPGETIYSMGVNFIVDKIESLDKVQITNNFKQLGISLEVDKYVEGKKGDKIYGSFMYATIIDYDNNYDFPGSVRIKSSYHKSFGNMFLTVLGLEYEKQFFVNVANEGSSLQAWNNTLLWYFLGLELNIEIINRQLIFGGYFSKPFVGNTDYGGDNKRTMDGNRVFGKFELEVLRNVRIKSEVIWSEMSSQGLTDLKNTHLTSATYLIYSF